MEEAKKAPSVKLWLKTYVDQQFANFFELNGGDLKGKYSPKWVSFFFNAFIDLEHEQAMQFVIPSDLRQFFLDQRVNLKAFLAEKTHHFRKYSSAPLDIQTLIDDALNMLEDAMRGADGIPESNDFNATTKLIRDRILFVIRDEDLKALLGLYMTEHFDNFLTAHPFTAKPDLDLQVQFTYFVLGQYEHMHQSFVTYLLQNSGYLIQDIKKKFSGENDAVLWAIETYIEKKMDDMKTVTPPLPALHFMQTERLPQPPGGVDRNAETPIPRPRGKYDIGRDASIVSKRTTIRVLAVMAVIGVAGMIKDTASTDPIHSPRVSAPASPPRMPNAKTSTPATSRVQTPPSAPVPPGRPIISPPPAATSKVPPATKNVRPREPRLPHKGERLRNAPVQRPQQTTSPSPAPEPVAPAEVAPAPRPLALHNVRVLRLSDGSFHMAYRGSGAILGIQFVLETSNGNEVKGHVSAICRGRQCRSASFTANIGQPIVEIPLHL